MNAYQQQEAEARAYNKAFLHGKEYGLSTGMNVAIDQVLEIIDTVDNDLDFGTKEKCVALSIKEKVLALKGGERG